MFGNHCVALAALCFISVFILPVRGPSIYGQLRSTNNHSPQVKNLLLLSATFLRCLCVRSHCLLIACLFFLPFSEPMRIWPIPKGAKPFLALFLSVTSLCMLLKHSDPCLVCSLGGTHTKQMCGCLLCHVDIQVATMPGSGLP